MSVVISDDILQSARMDESEIKREIAIMLYQKQKISLAKAAKFADMNRIQFQHLLAFNKIPVNYDIEDLEIDIKTLEKMDES